LAVTQAASAQVVAARQAPCTGVIFGDERPANTAKMAIIFRQVIKRTLLQRMVLVAMFSLAPTVCTVSGVL
jgi:hypothetical protein